jgi:glycosyltransferase involved in cell wall biosynthesis
VSVHPPALTTQVSGDAVASYEVMPRLRVLIVAAPPVDRLSDLTRTVGRLQTGLLERGHLVDVIRPAGLRRLKRSLHHYDIINVHGPMSAFNGAGLLWLQDETDTPPLVYTHHVAAAEGSLARGAAAWVERRIAFRIADQVVLSAEGDVSTTQGWKADGAEVIPLGIDLPVATSTAAKPSAFTILAVQPARTEETLVLMRAVARVHGARLVLIGPDHGGRESRALADAHRVDLAEYLGNSDAEVRSLCQRAHVLVIPPTPGMAVEQLLLEGMAARCVPIAAALPRFRGTLGRIGFGYPAASTDGLADVLRYLRDRPVLTSEIGNRARSQASGFTTEQTLTDYERLFQDIVFARRLRSRASDAAVPQQLADHIRHGFHARRAELVFADWNGSRTTLDASENLETNPPTLLSRTMARYVLASGEPTIVAPGQVPRGFNVHPASSMTHAMGVPLRTTSGTFGILMATRDQPFGSRDLEGLWRFARLVSVGMHHWASAWRPDAL